MRQSHWPSVRPDCAISADWIYSQARRSSVSGAGLARMSDTHDRIRAASAHLSSVFSYSSATSQPMQEVDEEQLIGTRIAIRPGGGPSGLSRLIERSRSHAPDLPTQAPTEHTTLLDPARPSYGATDPAPDTPPVPEPPTKTLKIYVNHVFTSESVKHGLAQAAASLPAVVLGMLLNILDGVSYGVSTFPDGVLHTNILQMIIFPAGEIFANFAGIGVSMFFIT